MASSESATPAGANGSAGGAAAQAGTDYENRIAAWASVLVLAGQAAVPPFGLPPTTTLEAVHCQASEPIDDVLVGTSIGRGFIQAKHGLQFSQGVESEFAKALAQCVRQFVKCSIGGCDRPLDAKQDRLVIAADPTASSTIRHALPRLLNRIRALLPGRSLSAASTNAEESRLLTAVRALIQRAWRSAAGTDPTEEDERNVLSMIWIAELDVDDGGREERDARRLLREVILNDPTRDEEVWRILVSTCAGYARNRSGADRAALNEVLKRLGIYTKESRQADVVAAFAANTSVISRAPSIVGLGTVPRTELAALTTSLDSGPVLLVGSGGTGKSGLAALVAQKDAADGRLVLGIDAGLLPRTAISPTDIGGSLIAPLDIAHALWGMSGIRKVTFIVDQLDTKAGTPVCRALVQLLLAASGIDGARVLAVSRTYEANRVEEILQLPFQRVSVGELAEDQAKDALERLGVTNAPEPLVRLACNVLGLSLIADLAQRGVEVSQIAGEVQLWDTYRRNIEAESAVAVDRAISLAWEAVQAGGFGVPVGAQPHDDGIRVLRSRGVLDESTELRHRFRHQRIRDYLVAWDAARQAEPLRAIRTRVPSESLRGVIRWLVPILHTGDPESEKTLVEAALADKTLEFAARSSILEALREQGTPYPATVAAIAQHMQHEGYVKVFFDGLHQAWLQPLRLAGALAVSPDNAGQYWWPLDYLKAQVPVQPEEVARTLEALEVRNPRMLDDLFPVAAELPSAAAARVAQHLATAVDAVPSRVRLHDARSAASLIRTLASGQEIDASTGLLESLLRPRLSEQAPDTGDVHLVFRPDAEPVLTEHDVTELLRLSIPTLVKHDATATRASLERVLAAYLNADPTDDEYSTIWRPTLDGASNEYGYGGAKARVIVALRDVAEAACKENHDAACALVRHYIEHQYALFRRLGLYLLRVCAHGCDALIDEAFRKAEALGDRATRPEFTLLLAQQFPMASAESRGAYIDWVVEKLDTTERQEPSDERQYLRDHTLRNFLSPVREHLTPTEQARLSAADIERASEFQPLPEPEVTVTAKPVPDVPGEKLPDVPGDELVALLRDTPTEQDVFGRDNHPYSASLRKAAEQDPERFIGIFSAVFGDEVPPVCAEALLDGLANAASLGRAVPWGPLLSTAAERIGMRSAEGLSSFAATRAAWSLLKLLEHALAPVDSDGAGAEHDEALKLILFALLRHPDPNDGPEGSDDPTSLAINAPRSYALDLLLRYARRRVTRDNLPIGSRLEGDVREHMLAHLDPARDTSAAVHSVFGSEFALLAWLDRAWLHTQTPLVFPDDPEFASYWHAAWEGYIGRTAFHTDLYQELRPFYFRAVDELGMSAREGRGATHARERLAQSIALAYADGWEPLDDSDGLLARFVSSAPEAILAQAFWFIGVILRDRRPTAESDLWSRARMYWEARVASARARGTRTAEMKPLVHWLDAIPVALPDLEALLVDTAQWADFGWQADDIVDYIGKSCEEFPAESMRVLSALEEHAEHDAWRAIHGSSVEVILRSAIQSRDDLARAAARRFVNRAAERGQTRYLHFLDE